MLKLKINILVLIIVILTSCEKREHTNPFDTECPKELWSPTNFKAVQEGTTVKLTWYQPTNHITGFNIQKTVTGSSTTNMPVQSSMVSQVIDNTLIGGKIHTYSITAYAGNNISNTVTTSITPIFTSAIVFNTSLTYGTLSDIDGNVYKTIKIGTQTWMASNLQVTKYNNNTAIPLVTDNNTWKNLATPGYCWYNNDVIANKNTYGVLYNWATVNTGKLCPTGWHVPTLAEWTILITYLGGGSASGGAGGHLKEIGFLHWLSPNGGADNSSGFTALPGGYRYNDGTFHDLSFYGGWWSSTEGEFREMNWNDGSIAPYINYNKNMGWSVRCIKD